MVFNRNNGKSKHGMNLSSEQYTIIINMVSFCLFTYLETKTYYKNPLRNYNILSLYSEITQWIQSFSYQKLVHNLVVNRFSCYQNKTKPITTRFTQSQTSIKQIHHSLHTLTTYTHIVCTYIHNAYALVCVIEPLCSGQDAFGPLSHFTDNSVTQILRLLHNTIKLQCVFIFRRKPKKNGGLFFDLETNMLIVLNHGNGSFICAEPAPVFSFLQQIFCCVEN